MVVAIVDTGIDLGHVDVEANIWTNVGEIAGNGIDDDHNGYVDDIHGWDFANRDNNPQDQNNHGTHVAEIVAAESNGFGATGVAFNATVMPVQVLGTNGSGASYNVAAGIRYAVDNGADVVNLSLGGGGVSRSISSALTYAQQHDVLAVAASGNSVTSIPDYPARYSESLTNVISVGAHNQSNRIAGFSNDVGFTNTVQVDAPGVSVYSTVVGNRYSWFSGTSMAAPQVAGLAALTISANPNLSASQVRSLIVGGATRTISQSDANGGVNAAVTVARAQNPSASNVSGTSSSGTNSNNGFVRLSGSTVVRNRFRWYATIHPDFVAPALATELSPRTELSVTGSTVPTASSISQTVNDRQIAAYRHSEGVVADLLANDGQAETADVDQALAEGIIGNDELGTKGIGPNV